MTDRPASHTSLHWLWYVVAILIGVLLAEVVTSNAHAQRTGGSFGGSAWGSGSRVSSPSISRPSFSTRPSVSTWRPSYMPSRPTASTWHPSYTVTRPAPVVVVRRPAPAPIVVVAHPVINRRPAVVVHHTHWWGSDPEPVTVHHDEHAHYQDADCHVTPGQRRGQGVALIVGLFVAYLVYRRLGR